MDINQLKIPEALQEALMDAGARFCALSVDAIQFDPVFRTICSENACGKYGRCWTCPPDVGEPADLQRAILRFDTILVFSKVYRVEDAFDLPGMLEAGRRHNQLSLAIQRVARRSLPDSLTTGAGACTLCESCTRPENLPCRFPDEALVSLEAYGINVLELAKSANLPYQGEKNTVAYFSSVLYCQAGVCERRSL